MIVGEMRNILLLIAVFVWGGILNAQVMTSDPAIPTDENQVTLTFYADRGDQGLKDYTGDVYAHTGLITDKSTSGSDWKYAPTWGDNDAKYKMTRVSANVYTLDVTPSVREYYGVAAGDIIEQMAFVFRSGDKSKTGKDTGSKDIFVDVSAEELAVSIESPLDKLVVTAGTDVVVKANSILSDQLTLFVNDVEVKSTGETSIQHTITAVSLDQYVIKASASAGGKTVEATSTIFVRGDVVEESLPVGLKRGVNRLSESSVTVVLFAPAKEFVYLMGDFNNWEARNEYLMKKDGDYFWLTLEGLDPQIEYAYQFWFDGGLKVADPYANKILDPWNDKYITDAIYPNLKAYPEGKTDEIVSVFNTQSDAFQWTVSDFVAPKTEDLVVYEILIRDFTHERDIKTITDTLSYLKRLGVNAIELMPFNEFEGNDSWGYNPSFYFATDKAYGTVADYKTFIDECHKNGMAVIMDMVLNHSFGQSPFARMYLEGGKPAANNPWYNREHNMQEPAAQWGHDFNHESIHTKELTDSICSYWMSEFKVDGFRFDFTKGFTNTKYGVGDWASAYDAPRIAILKRMVDEIWKRKSDAIVIFEHLAENSEEKELAEYGILFWGNHNHNYNEATMGYHENGKSDFSWASYQERGWSTPRVVNYMESHDEERLMYKNLQYGNTAGDYSTKELGTALKRMEAAAAFFYPIPGPKMIWQFGELGFDVSIDDPDRLAPKPPKWEYLDDEARAHLFKVHQTMIALKHHEPVFSTDDFVLDVRNAVKRIELNMPGDDVRIIGNFDVVEAAAQPNFSDKGWWYNYNGQDSINVTDPSMQIVMQPGEYVIYSQQKLEGFESETGIWNRPESAFELQVAPNPFRNRLVISTEMPGIKRVELFTITGMKVKELIMQTDQHEVSWGDLPRGNYLIRVNNDKDVSLMKLLKL